MILNTLLGGVAITVLMYDFYILYSKPKEKDIVVFKRTTQSKYILNSNSIGVVIGSDFLEEITTYTILTSKGIIICIDDYNYDIRKAKGKEKRKRSLHSRKLL